MRVADLMTSPVRFVGTTVPLKEAAATMTQHAITGLPVVTEDGRLVGVVSRSDVVKVLASDAPATTVGEAMTSPAITIGLDEPISEAAQLMLQRSVNRLPVVVAEKLVGIVSRSDLVRAFTRSDAEIAREIDEVIGAETLPVEPPSVSVEVERGFVSVAGVVDSLEDAQRLYRRLSRVPGVVSVRSTLTWRRDTLATSRAS